MYPAALPLRLPRVAQLWRLPGEDAARYRLATQRVHHERAQKLEAVLLEQQLEQSNATPAKCIWCAGAGSMCDDGTGHGHDLTNTSCKTSRFTKGHARLLEIVLHA
jgi:hypothetical protein